MSDMTKLNEALADLKAEVSDIGVEMDALFKAFQDAHNSSDQEMDALFKVFQDAHNSGDQAAIDAAAAAIEEQVAALKAIGDRDAPPVV